MSSVEPEATTPRTAPALRAIYGALDAAANPMSMLIMLAGLVRTLGTAEYGVLAIALAASGITMAVNPAIATTTTKFVSEIGACRSDSSRGSVAGVVTAALAAVVMIDVVLVASTFLWSQQLSNWVYGEASHFPGKRSVLTLAMVAVGIQQIDAVIGAALRGLERFRLQALIELSMRGALSAVVILVAWYTGSVAAVLEVQCLVFAAFMLIRTLALRALLPERRIVAKSRRRDTVSLLRYASWMWLTAIAGVAYTNGDRIYIGRVFGMAAAGEYSIYVQITQIIHFVPSSLFAFSLPAFSRLSATGTELATLARTYDRYFIAMCASALAITVILMVSWPLVMRVFSASDLPIGTPSATVLLLALNFLFLSTNAVPYYLLLALGESRWVSLVISGCMCVSLVLMFLLIPRYGMGGAAVARLGYGVGALSFIVKAQRLLKSP